MSDLSLDRSNFLLEKINFILCNKAVILEKLESVEDLTGWVLNLDFVNIGLIKLADLFYLFILNWVFKVVFIRVSISKLSGSNSDIFKFLKTVSIAIEF